MINENKMPCTHDVKLKSLEHRKQDLFRKIYIQSIFKLSIFNLLL